MATYIIGELVRVSAEFTDEDGETAVDPAVVKCQYKDPAGVVTTLTYGVDAELVKDETGGYHVDIDADLPGLWSYYFYSETTYQAADSGTFYVEPSGVTA